MPTGYKEDLSGQNFGYLLAIKKLKIKNKIYYKCECVCNKTKNIRADALKSGATKSCGCMSDVLISKKLSKPITHGMTNTKLYNTYRNMKQRCTNENSKDFKNYGRRGIKVCDEWLGEDGFDNFHKWAMENEYSDELTLDRVDVNGNYEPDNCRWATYSEQANNKRSNHYIEINGEIKTISDWQKENNLKHGTIYRRLKKGLQGEELIAPVQNKKLKKQSGVKGINWREDNQKWRVQVKNNNTYKTLGHYKELSDAIEAKREYFNKQNNQIHQEEIN